MSRFRLLGAILSVALICPFVAAQSPEASDWGYYGGDVFGQRYSNLDQINRSNVSRLRVAWIYRTGELGEGLTSADRLTFEATPVLAFGMLYLSTATDIVVALDPLTGRPRWRFDPHVNRRTRYREVASRGVSVWQDPDIAPVGVCTRRIFIGTLDARLIALDAITGSPCTAFGNHGAVDLTVGIRVREPGAYLVTSPPAVSRDAIIVGSAIAGDRAVEVERGVIRAFDARNGTLRWSFDPIPDSPTHPAAADWHPDQAARTGAGNAWGVMSVDPASGAVFVPTGSASPNFYGGERLGSNRFADSLLALDGATGRLLWQQQLIHHDLWDYDVAAQPVLVSLETGVEPRYAVLEATQSGMLFAFERDTGKPIIPIIERPVPRSTVRGEQSFPTQPFPQTPPLVSHEPLDPDNAWGITFWDRAACRALLRRYRNAGTYTPPDPHGSISVPGNPGGVGWGGIAFDTRRERVIAAVNQVPTVVELVSRQDLQRATHSAEFAHAEVGLQLGTPYAVLRQPLLSPWGLPCTPPPWGTLVSIDLRSNRIVWEVPLGTTEDMGPWFAPTRNFGVPSAGGPIATAGELVFIAAAVDDYFRAFDIETGRELWRARLPAGGQATPMTYRAGRDQRQYVVIAAGGHARLGTRRGDYVIAFALP
ncbi:MAG TPA: pyrroloquinoline quinone-dependent dehydrogenase [Steroidobacteraceae bacterium]|nr:pyrroloquinoline quinone-dependent dehydrogenase [Steroidobacteraceae bacterium]